MSKNARPLNIIVPRQGTRVPIQEMIEIRRRMIDGGRVNYARLVQAFDEAICARKCFTVLSRVVQANNMELWRAAEAECDEIVRKTREELENQS